jgi:hypothetical protein
VHVEPSKDPTKARPRPVASRSSLNVIVSGGTPVSVSPPLSLPRAPPPPREWLASSCRRRRVRCRRLRRSARRRSSP